jgi:hypothetical protein
LPHLWPTGSSRRWLSSTTARYFSSSPSDSTSRWTPCPPGVLRLNVSAGTSLGCIRRFQLRARLGCSMLAFPAGEALPPPLDMAPLIRAPEGLQPSRSVRCPAHTMSRSDSRPQPLARLCLPARRQVHRTPPRCAGPPRFLDRSVHARRPQPPRQARRLLSPVASPSMAGFTFLGRMATCNRRNEAESGSLALRLTCSLPGASPAGLLQPTSGLLPVERAIDRVTSFQVTRSARLRLAHPRRQVLEEEHDLLKQSLDLTSCEF